LRFKAWSAAAGARLKSSCFMKVWARFRIGGIPARVANAAGTGVTVYSRYGFGNSDLVAEPRPVSYMHDEALHALPHLLATLPIEKRVRVGHGDGGSMALIDAEAHDRVRGRMLLAPHVFVEDLSVRSIEE
jgi:pimeloyl-ACP methyl ester carboxylesterase